MVSELNEFYAQLAESVDFLTVYIAEAHASDEWPIGSRFKYTQSRTIASRIAIANEFISRTSYTLPTVVDPCYQEDGAVPIPVSIPRNDTHHTHDTQRPHHTDDIDDTHGTDVTDATDGTDDIKQIPLCVPRSNPFEAVYAPWPIRFYLVSNSKLAYIAAPDECSYDWTDIKQRLIRLTPTSSASSSASPSS